MRKLLCLSLLCVVVLACGATNSSNVSTENTSSVAGTWTGTWLSRNGIGGTTTMTLGTSGDGTVSFTNSPCFASGVVSASVVGDNLSATVTAGAIVVTIEATVTGLQLSGTYDAVSAGACTGDTGSFSATR